MYCSNWHGGILRTNDIYLAKHVPLGLESKCGVRIVYLDPEDGMVGFFVVMVCRVRGHAACFPCFLLLSTFSALSLISPFLFSLAHFLFNDHENACGVFCTTYFFGDYIISLLEYGVLRTVESTFT